MTSSRRPATAVRLLRNSYGRLPVSARARIQPVLRLGQRAKSGAVTRAQLLRLALLAAGALFAVVLGVVLVALADSGVLRALSVLVWSAAVLLSALAVRFGSELTRPASGISGARENVRLLSPEQVRVQSARFTSAAQAIHEAIEGAPSAAVPQLLPPEHGRPWVTIVVPAYNEKRFLADCLRSIQQQSFADWECIVVDDASTDTTASIALGFCEKDDRFSLVQHAFNQGLAAARNTGLAQATAPLVTFLDGDDLMTSASLADRVRAFRDHVGPDLAGVYCGVRNAPEERTLDELRPSYDFRDTARVVVDLAGSSGVCPFAVHQPLVRTDLVRHLGGFDESFRHGAEDYDFWMRLLRAGYQLRPSMRTTVIYRQRVGSMVREKINEHYDACVSILERLDQPWEDAPAPLPGGPLPVLEPMGVFQRRLVLAERAIRWTGLAAAHGKPEAALELIRKIEPWVGWAALRSLSIDGTVRAGVRRAWGVADDTAMEGYLPQVSSLAADVTRYLSWRSTSGVVEERSAGSGVVLCPADLAQAKGMAALVRAEPALAGATFLTLDEVAGDLGAHTYLEAEGLAPVRLRAATRRHDRIRVLVVSEPATVFARRLADLAAGSGATVIRLRFDEERLLVDESGTDLASYEEVDPAGLVAAVGAHQGDGAPWEAVAGLVRRALSTGQQSGLMKEERPDLPFDRERLREMKDAYRGQRCVIIGNGPSLNELDLSKMADVSTFAVNGIFYAADQMGFDPTFYVVEDTAVMADNTEEIKAYKAHHKLFPAEYRRYVGEGDEVIYFRMNRGFYAKESPHEAVPRFSTNASTRVYCGQSVTIINLQLAYWFGFSEVALIGMDFSYTVPDSVIKEGAVYTSTEADPNHFNPNYFGPGKKWKDPKLDRVLINYQLAKRAYEADGRRIVNATAGGNLHVFDRVDYDSWVAEARRSAR